MADWTDKFKQDADKAATDANRAADTQAADERAINAAFGPLWETVIERARVNAADLARKYPRLAAYDCDVVYDCGRNALTVRRKSYPFRNITIAPNPKARVLRVIKARDLDTVGNPHQPESDVIRFVPGGSDLTFECHSKPLLNAEDLCEYMFSWVCGKD